MTFDDVIALKSVSEAQFDQLKREVEWIRCWMFGTQTAMVP
jgi:hypothetical protein